MILIAYTTYIDLGDTYSIYLPFVLGESECTPAKPEACYITIQAILLSWIRIPVHVLTKPEATYTENP